jgi:hypothetical protein
LKGLGFSLLKSTQGFKSRCLFSNYFTCEIHNNF